MVTRRPRRTTTLRMRPHEPLRVITALGVSDQALIDFLQSKLRWIEKNEIEFQKRPAPLNRQGLAGESWMFLGNKVNLQEAPTVLSKTFVRWTENSVTLFWPEEKWLCREGLRTQAFALLENSLRERAEALMFPRVWFHAERTGLKPKSLRLMQAKTRWGSCSSQGRLNLNWRLIGAPLSVIDSVIVHELSHLKHLNHSEDFWRLVESFDPSHKESDRWLDVHQALL